MTAPRVFPNLPDGLETRLRAVVLSSKGDTGYFDDPRCPYTPGEKEILRKVVAEGDVGSVIDRVQLFSDDEAGEETILREVEETIEVFKAIEKTTGMEPNERIQVVKAKTGLIDKWVTLKERVYNMREMSKFQAAIMSIMEDVLDKDQRLLMKDKMRGLLGTK